jgi:hypothetical protein
MSTFLSVFSLTWHVCQMTIYLSSLSFILLRNSYFGHGMGIYCILSQCSVCLESFMHLEISKRNAPIIIPFVTKCQNMFLLNFCRLYNVQ